MSSVRPDLPSGEPIPKITSIKVGGYKSLFGVHDVKLGSLTVLAGANSSGKSSVFQPILLLKQSMDQARGGAELALSGAHYEFTDKEQIVARRDANLFDGSSADLTIGLTLDEGESMYQVYSATNGKPLGISAAHYCMPRFGSDHFELRSGMDSNEIQAALQKFLPLIHSSYEPVRFKARVEKGLLLVSLDLTRKDTLNEGPNRPLYALDVPFGDGFYRAVSGIVHVRGVRWINRTSKSTLLDSEFLPGPMDTHIASVLLLWQQDRDDRLEKLKGYLQRLELTSSLNAEQINDSTIALRVSRSLTSEQFVSIVDVGFGVSQVLPVLVALLYAQRDETVYIEQPEVHLHPNAQVVLAHIIAESVAQGVRVVIETHSELILLAIQTAVASGKIEPEAVVLHWFSRDHDSGYTSINTAALESDGSFGNWPSDFSNVAMEAQLAYLKSISALSN